MLDPTPAASCRSRLAKRRCSLASAKLAASTSVSVQSWPAEPRASSPVAFCAHGAIARPPPSVGVLDNESRQIPRDQALSAVPASRPRPIVGNRKLGRMDTLQIRLVDMPAAAAGTALAIPALAEFTGQDRREL